MYNTIFVTVGPKRMTRTILSSSVIGVEVSDVSGGCILSLASGEYLGVMESATEVKERLGWITARQDKVSEIETKYEFRVGETVEYAIRVETIHNEGGHSYLKYHFSPESRGKITEIKTQQIKQYNNTNTILLYELQDEYGNKINMFGFNTFAEEQIRRIKSDAEILSEKHMEEEQLKALSEQKKREQSEKAIPEINESLKKISETLDKLLNYIESKK